jgi:hypothetical protein
MLAPPETRAFFYSSTLSHAVRKDVGNTHGTAPLVCRACARKAVPMTLPLWSAELRTRTKRLDRLERLDSGFRACAAGAGGGRRRSRLYIIPNIRKNARYRKYTISVYCDIVYT